MARQGAAERRPGVTGPTEGERDEGPRRVAVVGTSGSGKTTFAREVAGRLGVAHVETDALFWEPRWRQAGKAAFRARVSSAVARDSWVMDGNFGSVRDLVWPRADTVVWLDYSLPTILARLLRRTARRIRGRETLWAGNRESLERALSPKDSILAWAMRTHGKHRRRYPAIFRDPRWAHVRFVRLRSPPQADAWLDSL